ncbi:Txe/YoeB family addiction module toxin [Carnobacteriaceae bacterium zg-ZUI252]|nr:Txe/YoeB family addiction module toxin [Carnobacteriaceae bacterium zg-ZUI252]MBS4769920.1 Txe/YoeB family addiction module toxin [Carnobacteriaceae bacterium zg-ZUI240]
MSNYKIMLLKRAKKDKDKIKQHPILKNNVEKLIVLLQNNPYQMPPSYEKLKGDLLGYYSRRINRQHRLIYKVDETNKMVYIFSMWTHYE